MLRWWIRRRLAAAERDLGYDLTYARDILDADLGAFVRFFRVAALSSYRKGVPRDAYYAAKLVGTLVEDCGPCTQLMVTLADREGVSHDVLRAVLAGDDGALGDDAALGVRFARAALAHGAEADELREQVRARWGDRGLVSLAFALAAARVYPTVKYALGHGRACTRVMVAGQPARLLRPAAEPG